MNEPHLQHPEPLPSSTLYYREGTSDKVYQASIVAAGQAGFTVAFAYGRRGSTLQTGTKTATPVPYARAKAIYDKLVREKTAKGYTVGPDGTPYRQPDGAARHTGVACQLLNPIADEELEQHIKCSSFVMQEKFDGRRLLVRRQGNAIAGQRPGGAGAGAGSSASGAPAWPSRRTTSGWFR
jgi:bifunctional non-homologous end joining protein LigD